MGLRQVFQPRERSEIMALPYATADARVANEAQHPPPKPPRVYAVPPEWVRVTCMALFVFNVYMFNVLIAA